MEPYLALSAAPIDTPALLRRDKRRTYPAIRRDAARYRGNILVTAQEPSRYDGSTMADSSAMSRTEKLALITPWINPEERITVQFDDQRDINTVVTDCTEQLVDLELETPVPHMRQKLSIPLSDLEVSEDPTHYTRDPDKPLQLKRLMLIVKGKRPPIVY
jgi:hypothetical protein